MKIEKIDIKKLQLIQNEISNKVYIPNRSFLLSYFTFLVGIDLSFIKDQGIVCFSIFNTKTQKITYFYEIDIIKFPYIPTFLAFRELPLMNKLYHKINLPFNTLFFVDGHGLSHPRRAGIATHFAVVNNLFCVGIAKKNLYGKELNYPEQFSYIVDDNFNPIAVKIPTFHLGRKKIMNSENLYISVGNKLSLSNALNLFLEIYRKYNIILTELSHNYLQKLKKHINK